MANEKIFNIGRNEDNDIILNDITVSGQHAKLIVNSLGHLFLEDSNSLNGTWIFNGHDYEAIMRRARVKNKDRIRFGEGETDGRGSGRVYPSGLSRVLCLFSSPE